MTLSRVKSHEGARAFHLLANKGARAEKRHARYLKLASAGNMASLPEAVRTVLPHARPLPVVAVAHDGLDLLVGEDGVLLRVRGPRDGLDHHALDLLVI